MKYQCIELITENHVGIITLNRPEAGNAINVDLAKELLEVAIHCSENEEIRAVVLTGSGDKFSVGGDLKSFVKERDEVGSHLKIVTSYFHQAISHFVRMNKPYIVAINGIAAGGGMSLACTGDLIYASENTRLVAAYNKIGLTPDGAGSYFLPRMIGVKRAMELFYLNRPLSAAEAKEWGIINEVLPKEELLPFVIDLAKQLANGPTSAFGATKKLLLLSQQETLESQMTLESLTIAERASSFEGKEGIAAFLEKREANFNTVSKEVSRPR